MNYTEMSVLEIKKSLGYNENEIVEPEKLAEKLGIGICETSLDQKHDGTKIICAIVNKEKITVFYHKKLADGQGSEKVALTYALVHCVLCDTENTMITTGTTMTEQEEELIYELLMPESLVAAELASGASINSLAKTFGMPKKFVRERLDAMPVVLVNKSV